MTTANLELKPNSKDNFFLRNCFLICMCLDRGNGSGHIILTMVEIPK